MRARVRVRACVCVCVLLTICRHQNENGGAVCMRAPRCRLTVGGLFAAGVPGCVFVWPSSVPPASLPSTRWGVQGFPGGGCVCVGGGVRSLLTNTAGI